MHNETLILTNGGVEQLKQNTLLGKSQFEILNALAAKTPIDQILIQHKRAQDKINELISMELVEKKIQQAHPISNNTIKKQPQQVDIPTLTNPVLPKAAPQSTNTEDIDLPISQQDKVKIKNIIEFYDHSALNGDMSSIMDACFKDANTINSINDIIEAFAYKMKKHGRHSDLKIASAQIKTVNPRLIVL